MSTITIDSSAAVNECFVAADMEVVDARNWDVPTPDSIRGTTIDERLVDDAALAARTLPIDVDAALVRFARRPSRAGALLLRNVAIGDLPPTPEAPDAVYAKDLATELAGFEFRERKRFGKVITRAEFHRLHRRLHGRFPREHDDFQFFHVAAKDVQHIQPRHVGKIQIKNGDVELPLLHEG